MTKKIHSRLKACRNDYDAKAVISTCEYASKHHLTQQAVRQRIASRKLRGYKLGGKWWVVDHPVGEKSITP